MAYSPSKLILVGIGAVTMSSVAVMATLPRSPFVGEKAGPPSESSAERARSAKIAEALNKLEAQLQRRFHDRNNLSFGMSRIVRPEDRVHAGPLSETRKASYENEYRQTKDGKYEIRDEFGDFVPSEKLLLRMHPENQTEKEAIKNLVDSNTDVAIYTAGFIPKGAPTTTRDGYRSPYDEKLGARAKGPAYISSRTSLAPPATEVIGFARTTMDAKDTHKSGKIKDEWRTIAIKVNADDQSCLNCHNASLGITDPASGKGFRMGDTLGVIILAMRDAKPAPTR